MLAEAGSARNNNAIRAGLAAVGERTSDGIGRKRGWDRICRSVQLLGIHELWLFILSGLLLNVTPGPDTAYIIGRSIQLGWRGGAAAAIGISCGCLVHVFGAAIGLSALLMASSAAFAVVKLVGAAYLFVTGIRCCCRARARWRTS